MEIFVKQGLYNELYGDKLLKVLRKNKYVFFDIDFKKNFMCDFDVLATAIYMSSKGDMKMILNIMNIANSIECRYIAKELHNLMGYLETLIVTAPNDYFTLLLKRETKMIEEYLVSFAFREKKNMDKDNYFICDSASIKALDTDLSRIILDDTNRNIGSMIYDRNNTKSKEKEILIKPKTLF